MKRAIAFFVSVSLGIVASILFDHSSSRDFANYIEILNDPKENFRFNSIIFSAYSALFQYSSIDALMKYNILQTVSFCIFSDALLRLIRYDGLKLVCFLVLLSPVFVPLYFLVQIKMGMALAFFLSACASKGGGRQLKLITAFASHFYVFMLIYFSKFGLIKRVKTQLVIFFTVLISFILAFSSIDYKLRFFLGHQEQINVLNSLFIVYISTSAIAIISTGRRDSIFNMKTLVAGGGLVYLMAVYLGFPVLGFRTLEFFTAATCIALIISATHRTLLYVGPLLAIVTIFHAYYTYYVFGLFI